MQVTKIPLIHTSLLHPLAKAYLQNDPELKNFYAFNPSADGIAEAIKERKKHHTNRQLLSERLIVQYTDMDPDFQEKEENTTVLNSISALQNDKTFTITTGHQLNVFTGPLYFIYKIVSAINYCKWLNENFPENHFVPVYWMATEDHDLEEINHIHLFGKKFQWNEESGSAVGRINPQSMAEQISYVGDLIANKEEGQQLIRLFKKSYLHQPTLSLATRALVHELFKDSGLIIIDADDRELKQTLVPVMQKELLEEQSYKAINKSKEILGKNYKLPVNPRSINLFYLSENKRTRIEKSEKGNYFSDGVKKWEEKEILQELESDPENFSPNVVLRPVYQELILPNLAYIGGNNEIAYWLELKSAFDAFNVFFPQLLVRDSALWIGKKFVKDLKQMQMQPEDLLLSFDKLKEVFYERNNLEHPAEDQIDKLITENEFLKENIHGVAKELASTIIQQVNQHIKDLKRLKKEFKRNKEEVHEKSIQKLEKIYQSLYPEGSFQERYENFISYYLQHGQQFFSLLKENFNPLDADITIYADE